MFTTEVDIDTICSNAEAMCRRITPHDLGDTPLYIVPQSRVSDHLGGKAVCDGFTTPSLDLYLHDVIGPAWRGRGACMVVNDDFGEQADADGVELAVSAIVLHELAHVVERPAVYRDRQSDDPMRLQFESLCMGSMVASEPIAMARAAPFEGHGLRFIRAALHLRHRADLLGVLVPLYCFCAGNHYGLSHPLRYRDALGDEPTRLVDHRIRDILDTPCPKAFWRQWTIDMARWNSDNSPSSERSFLQCPSLP